MEVYRRYRDWVRRNGNVLALAETGELFLTNKIQLDFLKL